MRKSTQVLVSCLIILATLYGCAQLMPATSLKTKMASAHESFTAVLNTLNHLYDVGALTPEQQRQVAINREKAVALFAAMDAATNATDQKAKYDQVQAVLDILLDISTKAYAATQPATAGDPAILIAYEILSLAVAAFKYAQGLSETAAKEGRELTQEELDSIYAQYNASVSESRKRMPAPGREG